MADPELREAHLREYTTEKCDIRFNFNISKSNGSATSEEIIGFARKNEELGALARDIREKVFSILQMINDEKEEGSIVDLPVTASGIKVTFLNHEEPYPESCTLESFINLHHSEQFMDVLGQKYSITLNAPLVRKLALCYSICANFSLRPVHYSAQDADVDKTEFSWYKSMDKVDWEKVGNSFDYKVQESDIGYFLKVLCVPYNTKGVKGPSVEAISETKVQVLPEMPERCPFEIRHNITTEKLSNEYQFRVVSYNILADKYVRSDRYTYCSSDILCIHYRRKLLMRELKGYKADIICLQEVDYGYFMIYHRTELKDMGYQSIFNKKGNILPEGLVCAFDNKRFKILDIKHLVLRNIDPKFAQYKPIFAVLDDNEKVKNLFLQQPTSLQTVVLQDQRTKNIIVVANTHLCYHPEVPDIRLIQGFLIAMRLSNMKDGLIKKYRTKNVSVVLCGDFNSNPNESLYKLMTTGSIHSRHADCLKISPSGNAKLYNKLRLASACGTPKYTNYTKDFKDCIDYIFIDKLRMFVAKDVPVPSADELEKYEGLPNEFYPSDHVALVADLQFRRTI